MVITPEELKEYLRIGIQAQDKKLSELSELEKTCLKYTPEYIFTEGNHYAYKHILEIMEKGFGNANNRNDSPS